MLRSVNGLDDLITILKQIAPVEPPPSYNTISKEHRVLCHDENWSDSDSNDKNPYPWMCDDCCLVHLAKPNECLKNDSLGFGGTTWTEMPLTITSI